MHDKENPSHEAQSDVAQQRDESATAPAAPWRARNIYSHIKVKKRSVDIFIVTVLVLMGLLIAYFALSTKGLPVKFETYGGTMLESKRYMYGEKIERPEDPKREGFVFVDWYPNEALIAPWNFSQDVVQGEMTLHAKWKKRE